MNILVVDDSMVFQTFFRKTLEMMPQVKSAQYAANGRQAIFLMMSIKFDIVILDLEMPHMDGYETLKRIKKLHPEQKVIVCSGKTLLNYHAIQKVMALGADGLVSKTYQKGNIKQLDPMKFRSELVPKIIDVAIKGRILSPKSLLKTEYSKDIIDGILVIHMLEKNQPFMNYEFGKLEDGINAAAKLIATAHSTYTPVFIDDGIEQFKNIKAIEDSIESFHPALFSSMKSVKKQSIKTEWVHNGICDFLRRHAIGNLLIIGFNRSFCVAKAASQISGYYGVNIMIGLPLLFGHNAEDNDPMRKKESDRIVAGFANDYTPFSTLNELKYALTANAAEKRERFLHLSGSRKAV